MTATATSIAYLAASVCFILSLSGLSSPQTARRGNSLGIVGMLIAIVTTLLSPEVVSYIWIIGGLIVGGAIGTVIAQRISMTALPQLVAAFHSLVGLAAVFVASAALYSPASYGIGIVGHIHAANLVEMSLGMVIGAITFTASVIAFAKLQGIMSGAPIVFGGQRVVNALVAAIIILVLVWFVVTESHNAY
ncbi:MAG: NAD(P)(+) transhydrogenase (Re/Si-specific) subunit beta, partial [Candidatus Zixiibacteriota bacterium]